MGGIHAAKIRRRRSTDQEKKQKASHTQGAALGLINISMMLYSKALANYVLKIHLRNVVKKKLPDTQLIYFAFKFFNCKLLYCKIVTIQIASGLKTKQLPR